MLAPTPYFADRGCHVRIFEEARALRERGHDVRLVTYPLGRDLSEIPTYRTLSVPGYRKLAAGPSWHKPLLDLLPVAFGLETHFSLLSGRATDGSCPGRRTGRLRHPR